MLEKTKPEFVVALGHHAAMPAAFRFLVETGHSVPDGEALGHRREDRERVGRSGGVEEGVGGRPDAVSL